MSLTLLLSTRRIAKKSTENNTTSCNNVLLLSKVVLFTPDAKICHSYSQRVSHDYFDDDKDEEYESEKERLAPR